MFLIFQNCTQEISLYIALQLKNFSFSGKVNIISYILCIVCMIGNLIMIFWMTNIINDMKSSSIPQKYEILFNCLDLEKAYSSYFPLIKMIKKFLLSFCMVFLYDHILILIICLCLLNILMYLYIRIVEPFENKYRNIIAEITEFLICCLYCLFFLFNQSKIQSMDETGLYIGYISIFILTIIIVLNFGIFVLNFFVSIINFIYRLNMIGKELKLSENILKKFKIIKMKEFSYNKYWKDLKSGVWYNRFLIKKLIHFTIKAHKLK